MNRIILALTALLLSTSAWANVPNATPLKNTYTCNSSTTQFPYGFQITATSDMTVYLTDSNGNTSSVTTNFTVDTNNLWVVYPTTGSPCPTGSQLTLVPATPQTQTTTYGARTPFTATAVGASFDKLTLISQQLQGQLNRTILAPVNSSTQTTFPSPSDGKVLGWTGGALVNLVPNTNAYITTSTDGTFASNSDSLIPTQKATKTYVDTGLATKASTGANSTITSLTGLSTPLSVGQGGTGATATANTANGVVILNASGQIPAMSGINLTNISGVNLVNLASTSSGAGVFPVANLGSGSPSSANFLRGDGAFAAETNNSNVLFQYAANVDHTGSAEGEVVGTTLTPGAVTGNYRFWQTTGNGTPTAYKTKWKKIAGDSTVTVYAQIWQDGTDAAGISVNIGGATGTVAGTNSQTTPEWKNVAVDVSGLSNGTVYDVTVTVTHSNPNGTKKAYMGNIISFGS